MRMILVVVVATFLSTGSALAGGPIQVGGPHYGVEGVPFTWDPTAFPIRYHVDGGPLSATVDHATAVARVDAMFGTWSSVATATLQYQDAGAIMPTGSFSDGDVNTLQELSDVRGSCDAGVQSAVVFDADGSMLKALNVDPDVIGLTGICQPRNGSHFVTAMILLNGLFQDGISSSTNFEMTSDEFDETITHEIGHLSGLDHAQINVGVLNAHANCSTDDLAGLPLMFPFAACQSKKSAGLPMLAPDDIAWISYLYPNASFNSSYGFIEGEVRFSDGITPVQGVNVIARSVSNPTRVAVSVVSGFLFTDEPGQALPGAEDLGGDPRGSRQANREGYFKIPVPAGQWTISLESINPQFTDGSSVGPLPTPVPMPGTAPSSSTVTVTAGQTTTVNFTLIGTPPRFDLFENESLLIAPPVPYVREEEVIA